MKKVFESKNLKNKVSRKHQINISEYDGHRVARTADDHLSDNKSNVSKDEDKSKNSEVNVLDCSPEPPVHEFLVPSLNWWSCWIIPL